MALKRKHSSNDLIVSAGDENERRRKRRRTESSEKLLSLHFCDWSSSSDQATAPINETLAEDDFLSCYEIGKMLGEGGFGCVYEGKRLEDGLEVAVKIASKPRNMKYIYVPGHHAPLPSEVALLLLVNKEPRAPEIITLLDWQDQPQRYILVMERPSPCKDLWDYVMLQGGFLNEDIARFIMAQATKAAHTCCQRGVFHRDIKLENLLIHPERLEVKLIDFGCGDLLQDSGYERFCGTPEYCPPEYYVAHRYHGKPTTVWSLGVLLFMLVCGRYPEPRDVELIDDGVWFEPDLSNECSHLIRSLLNESPSRRIDLGEILLHDWFKVLCYN
ncbi:serine/threonine-protein kinase pim-2-like [Carassius gibelio]|uniref:serine/threonine-protein kinase pim-2-like n=1 Tax=Carassius gibelio TaxID=101364 RepID=UPI002277C71A|nr:serine/threonine-protein kinase pim-2-like [Carassius gibelio]